MKLEKETSIYQLGAIGGIQTTAESKNSVFYQATAPPTTGRKVNDVWYDSDDGNAMYKFDGTQWVQTQFGTNAIVAGSVTAAKLNSQDVYTNFLLTNFVQAAQASFSSLSAITADIGICTAGKVQSSDYSYTSGNYSTAGMQIDLDAKIYRTPKTAILSDGSIYSTSINVSGGSIAGFDITGAQLYSEHTASGTTYKAFMQCYDPNVQPDTRMAFAVSQNDGTDTTYPFIVRYNGQVEMTNAVTKGLRINTNANDVYINFAGSKYYCYNTYDIMTFKALSTSYGVSLNANEKANVTVTSTVNGGHCVLQAYDGNDNAYGFLINPTDEIIANGTIHGSASVLAAGAVASGGKTSVNSAKAGVWLASTGNVYLTGDTSAGSYIYFYYGKATTNTASIAETASGEISISAPNGFKVANIYNTTTSAAANVSVESGGRMKRYSSSSKRYKHDIKVLQDYKKVLDIPVVSFVYNNGYLGSDDQRYMKDIPGFIAEDVAEHYPIAADWADGRVEDWNVRYVIPPMLAVEQDHERRIRKLEEAIGK